MFDNKSEPRYQRARSALDATARRIDEIAEWERVIAHAHARQALAVAALVKERVRLDKLVGVWSSDAGKHATEEVALARGVSPMTANQHIGFAMALTEDHPATLGAMLNGTVSASAARIIVQECEVLGSSDRHAVDSLIGLEAGELTPGQVRKAVRRRVCAADPEAASRRARVARSRKRISFLPREDATASLWNVLPAEQAMACWTALDNHARGVRGDGDERSIEHIMCDAFVERLTGQRRAADVPVEVQVVISASSLLGQDGAPATLGRYGVIPAELARQLAASDSAFARRLVCDPLDGRVLELSTRKIRFDGSLRRFILARDQVCRLSVCDAPIRDCDHMKQRARGGRTEASNGQGLCERTHYCRDHPGWDLDVDMRPGSDRVTWITPTGHRYDSYPPPALGLGSLDATSLHRITCLRRRRRRRKRVRLSQVIHSSPARSG